MNITGEWSAVEQADLIKKRYWFRKDITCRVSNIVKKKAVKQTKILLENSKLTLKKMVSFWLEPCNPTAKLLKRLLKI